jgi:outer membrane protein OmpA-like peptidoglycan-associated protein
MRFLLTTLILIPLIYFSCASQADTLFNHEFIGVYPKGGLTYNMYSANFQSFQGAVDCGLFTTGSGSGWHLGVGFEKALGEYIQVGLDAVYFTRGGKLSVNNTFKSRNLSTNEIVNVTTENYIETKLSYFEFMPELRYVIAKNLINGPFRFLGGLRIAIPVTKSYEQKERIVFPENAVFINSGGIKTQQRNIASGDIQTLKSVQLGITAGLENMLKIGKNSYFTQQVSFDYNLGNVTSDAEWQIYAFNLTLGLRFSVIESEPKPLDIQYEQIPEEKKPEIIAEVEKPKPVLNVKIETISNLSIETGNEVLATLPLVNAIFFIQNSSEIPGFYILDDKDPNMEFYFGDAVDIHKYALIRIARIMKQNPNSSIVLESSTSGTEDELQGIELSLNRAESVKKSLMNLGISESKISINALQLPKIPSSQEDIRGKEENRRVEMILKNAPLMEYVDIQKFKEIKGTIDLNLNFKNIDGNYITVFENINNTKTNYDKPGKQSIKIKTRVPEKQNELNINVLATGKDLHSSDKSIVSIGQIPNENKELYLDNFEAVLMFTFNSSELSDANKALLKQLVDKVPENSTISIIGSTDILGTVEYNTELAKQRASITEKFIKTISGNKLKIETNTNINKFEDTTQQGRFLNRSIKIRVKK